jgi:integrase
VRRVRVCSALLEILRRRRAKTLGPVVFPNEKGGALGPSGRAFQETLHEVLAQAGFPLVEREGKLRPHLRFEDLRHSFAAQWMMRGGSISTLQQMLGHKSAEMTARYSAFAPDRSAEDLERFSGFPSS